MKKLGFLLFSILLNIFFVPISTNASLITFIHIGNGSGTLKSVAFSDTDFTITAIGDTTNRESFSTGFFINHDNASIIITGIGDLNFITPTRTFINDGSDLVGFSRAPPANSDLFNGPNNIAFDGWDMSSSIGPITGTGRLLQWNPSTFSPVETNRGILVFNSESVTATFQADVVPLPSTLLLLFSGLIGLVGLRHKKS